MVSGVGWLQAPAPEHKHKEQMALLMQMITEGQQQQQLIAQEQRAWREELVKEQWAQKERQELCESGLRNRICTEAIAACSTMKS